MKIKFVLAAMAAGFVLSAVNIGCGSTSNVAGGYTEVRWDYNDMKEVCDYLVRECENSSRIKDYYKENGRAPTVILGTIGTGSGEKLDTSQLAKRFQDALINSGIFEFVSDSSERQALRGEKTDQDYHASEETAKTIDNESGADFMLLGEVYFIRQNRQTATYSVMVQLHDIERNRIMFSKEFPVKATVETSASPSGGTRTASSSYSAAPPPPPPQQTEPSPSPAYEAADANASQPSSASSPEPEPEPEPDPLADAIFLGSPGMSYPEWVALLATVPYGSLIVLNEGLDTVDLEFFASALGESNLGGVAVVMHKITVSSISEKMFYNCAAISAILLPESVTEIGASAFYGCINLRQVIIMGAVRTIAAHTFDGCSKLFDVRLPETVTAIESYAFNKCVQLESIKLPDSLETIGEAAFYGCEILSSAAISGNVSAIQKNTFAECKGLQAVTIPDSVTVIGERAFYKCSALKSVKISSKVTTIGKEAFEECKSLMTIEIPSSVTSFGKEAFQNCEGLKTAEIDCSTAIPGNCFSGCNIMLEAKIGDSVTSIGSFAFSHCWALKNLTIGRRVSKIADRAFLDCESLAFVSYNGTKAEYEAVSVSTYDNRALLSLPIICTDGTYKYSR